MAIQWGDQYTACLMLGMANNYGLWCSCRLNLLYFVKKARSIGHTFFPPGSNSHTSNFMRDVTFSSNTSIISGPWGSYIRMDVHPSGNIVNMDGSGPNRGRNWLKARIQPINSSTRAYQFYGNIVTTFKQNHTRVIGSNNEEAEIRSPCHPSSWIKTSILDLRKWLAESYIYNQQRVQ